MSHEDGTGIDQSARHRDRVGITAGAGLSGLVAGALLTAGLIPAISATWIPNSSAHISAHAPLLAEQPEPVPGPAPLPPGVAPLPGPGPANPQPPGLPAGMAPPPPGSEAPQVPLPPPRPTGPPGQGAPPPVPPPDRPY